MDPLSAVMPRRSLICLKNGLMMLLLVGLPACENRMDLAPVVHARWLGNVASMHRVVRGDTLYSIAFRYDKDYRRLARFNHLQSPYVVRVGQVIWLQPTSLRPPYARRLPPPPRRSFAPLPRTVKSAALVVPGWRWPAKGRVVSTFDPTQGRKGITIGGHKGEAIYAASSGVVAYAGSGLAGYGNLIIIKHANEYLTAYGNNLHNKVKEGQPIKAGQVIAEMGVVDRRFWGVHFEIRHSGKPMNPLQYLRTTHYQ